MQELKRRMTSAKAWGVEPVSLLTPAEVKELVPFLDETVILGAFYSPGRRRRRLPPRRHADARAGGRARSPHRLGEHRGARHRDRARTRHRRQDDRRRHRDRRRRHRLRRLEPEARADGGRVHSAHAGRAPDDRHRPRPPVRGREARDRVPDRPRHGHEHVRAPGRNLARDRLVRAPRDPVRPRGPALGRGSCPLAHRVPVHAGGLRAAARARARADARDRRRRERRHQVRDQRDPLPHPRRDADPGRDARGEGPLVGGGRLGEGRPGRRQGARGVDGARRVRDRPPLVRRRALPRPPPDERAREGAHRRGLQQDLRDRPPARAVGVEPQRPALALPLARTRARRGVLRGGRVGAPAVVRVERTAARGVRRPGRAARGRVGLPLVVADHQRGASRDA